MNGATLRGFRKLMGYERAHFADRFDVNVKSLTRWEHRHEDVPEDVADTVTALIRQWSTLRDDMVSDAEGAVEAAEHDGDNRREVTLRTVLHPDPSPLDHRGIDRLMYNSAAAAAAVELAARGIDTVLDWREGL